MSPTSLESLNTADAGVCHVCRLRVYDLPTDALDATPVADSGECAALAAAPDSFAPPLRIKVRRRPRLELSQQLPGSFPGASLEFLEYFRSHT